MAQRFGVSVSTIGSWQRRQRESGNVAPSPRPGRPPRIGPEEHGALLTQVHTHPTATVAEHRALWEANRQVRVTSARCTARSSAPAGAIVQRVPRERS